MSPTNERLGYPADARLLLVNADDCGMYDAINEAVELTYQAGIVRSTSLMMPCPGAPAAAALLRGLPRLAVGVHLSIIRDIPRLDWRPLAPRAMVPSLLAEDGKLYPTSRQDELLARADIAEVATEFRAQVEAALAAQLTPTHLDWHCLANGGRPDIFTLTLALAGEYGLALRVAGQPESDQVRRLGLPTPDHGLLDSFSLPTAGKPAAYLRLLRELPAGLSEWAVHPGLDTAAARALDPAGWPVRAADHAFLCSPEAREVIRSEGIILIDYALLQRAWQDGAA